MTGMVADKTKLEGIVVEKAEEINKKFPDNSNEKEKDKNQKEKEKNKFIDSLVETQYQSEKLAVREKVDNIWLKL